MNEGPFLAERQEGSRDPAGSSHHDGLRKSPGDIGSNPIHDSCFERLRPTGNRLRGSISVHTGEDDPSLAVRRRS